MKFFDIPPPPPLTTLSAVGSNTVSTGTSIDYPTGILPGDLLWLQAGVYAWDPMHTTGPDGIDAMPAEGFEVVYDFLTEGLENRIIFQAKIASGLEAEAGSVAISSVTGRPSLMKIFRGDFPVIGVSLFDGQFDSSAADPSALTLSVAGAVAGKPAILFGAAWAGAGNPTVSGTLASGGVALTPPATVYKSSFQIQNGTKANRTWDMNDVSADNGLWAVGVSVF